MFIWEWLQSLFERDGDGPEPDHDAALEEELLDEEDDDDDDDAPEAA